MKTIADAIAPLLAEQPLGDDEYRDAATGLIHCSSCHMPRQTTLTVLGRTVHPGVPCQCQRERYERDEAERKQREEMTRIARMKATGLQDATLRGFTFANDSGVNPEMNRAHAYVEHWADMRQRGLGLLLWGDVGTGKSFFAGCIANALLDKGIPVLMTNFSRILNALTDLATRDRNDFIDSLNRYELLIIDDLGIERGTDFALEQVFGVIDSRYRSKKPLIVTTNLTLSELKHPVDLAHSRIYDRVLERCVPLRISNQNLREVNRAVNLSMARNLLFAPSATSC